MSTSLITVNSSGELTTTSLVVAEQFGREHKNVLASIKKLIYNGTIDRLDFKLISYKDRQNRQQKMYELTERGFLIAMPFIGGASAEMGQVRLVDAFLKAQKRQNEVPEGFSPRLSAKTAIAESAARMLRMSEPSKLRMLGKICEEEGVSAGFLPEYSTGVQLTKAIGDLLKEHGSGISARAANATLIELGLLEELDRRASGGKTKKFKSITDKGLVFGRNDTSPQSPNQTQPRYYTDKFPELLDLIVSARESGGAGRHLTLV